MNVQPCAAPASPPPSTTQVTFRHLTPADRGAIAAHLQRMDGGDRQLRFCQMRTDAQLQAYVAQLDFTRDAVLGAFCRDQLVGVCHLGIGAPAQALPGTGVAGIATAPSAELGISVDAAARGLRFGAALMNATFVAAAERGCREVHVFYLQHNHRMHGMCVRLGAHIERSGGECTARIPLQAEWREGVLWAVTAGVRRIELLA